MFAAVLLGQSTIRLKGHDRLIWNVLDFVRKYALLSQLHPRFSCEKSIEKRLSGYDF